MNIKKYASWVFYFTIPFLVIISIETIKQEGIQSALQWGVDRPVHFFITYFIILCSQSILFFFTKNVYIVCLSSAMFMVFWVIVDNEKLKMLNEPVLPWDLFFIKQLVNLFPVIYKQLNILVVLGVLIVYILFVYVLAKKTEGSSLPLKGRLIVAILSIIIIIFIGNFKDNFVGQIFNKHTIHVIEWDQKINQSTNGLVLGFILNMPSVLIDKPNNYNSTEVGKIVQQYEEKQIQQSVTMQKPNIIVIMSEAFWDIGHLDETLAQEKYIPNAHNLQVGTIASPQFGGGTANVEFEVLTGLSMNLLPAGSIAYQQYVKRETPSLASILSAEGYRSIAIHTYFKWFWDRENVYKHMGFDHFTSVTEMPDAQNKGFYVADNEITKEIIKEVEGNEQPVFIYAVTMQNHGSYYDHRYEDTTLQVSGDYSEETTTMLNTYVTGLVDADNELGSLVNYLIDLNEPTIVVFFGDHLPLLGGEYKAYTETGYLHSSIDWSLQDTLKMKETPLIMWNNIGKENRKLGAISTSFLGGEILEMAGLQKPALFEFTHQFSKQLPVYTATVKKTREGQLSQETPESLLPLEEQYQILQYDILFGKRYIESATN